MESSAQKNLERVISQKAMQMGSSFPCQIWVLGFFCGVCITYLSLVSLSPYPKVAFGSAYSGSIAEKSSSMNSDHDKSGSCNSLPKDMKRFEKLQVSEEMSHEETVRQLYSDWDAMLNRSKGDFLEGMKKTSIPNAPHFENCKLNVEINKRFDNRGENGSLPPWTLWRGLLGLELLQEEQVHFGYKGKIEGGNPPWIVGSDEDNFPLTRQVQQDIWIHQHPQDCTDPKVRFLAADWERLPGFGIGAQLTGMSGLLALAIKENRVLVTNYYNRADHDGCQGSSRSRWSCYFFPETSRECRDRAFDLMRNRDAWANGIVIGKDNYTSKQIWAGRVPRVWGEPWNYLQPTTEIDGNLLKHHRKMDRRWWRAQAIRYLMRFPSEYTCDLLNVARHRSFGMQAAEMVLTSLPTTWPKAAANRSQGGIEQYVWSSHKPWIPRPLLSMHVRMGDKACEMKIVGFENYMNLANQIRERFPNLNSVWLSTEMQEVIDGSILYPHWNFYYTNVTRQVGNMSMAKYEARLGRETSTNNPLVNFIMATEADFFIGALGSSWCYLIDGMRNTGGKVMAGYLSVNKDRFW